MPEPKRYRKKPVEITAVQWTGDNAEAVVEFMAGPGGVVAFEDVGDGIRAVRLTTVHGDTAYARPQDWIIPEPVPGRFYPCDAGVFAATYDEVITDG